MSTGWKTYAVAAALALYALGGLISGELDANHAFELVLEALALAGLRNAVK
jgi:hypothetical protein